jgi:hypothetical protein
MTSSFACANPANATSNAIAMTVTAAIVPSVTIAASPGSTICAGTPVTFTATPTNGGAAPSYQWKLNGNNVGTNSNQYQNSTLANGDMVTVVMTSSLACANPANATSNAIAITVTAAVAPSVSIAASPGSTICAGTPVTFTATPTNGGATPSYQWKLNGNNVGTNNNQYQNSTLANGDMVTVVMTSSLACANPANATSNAIAITVTAAVVPSVSISASPGSTICAGTNVTFTATPTNGGAPGYQWKLNGNNVGTNSNQYQNSTLANGDIVTVVMTSSLACATPANATSNGITMVVAPCNVILPILNLRTYPVKEGDVGITMAELQVTLDRPAPLQVRINYATSDDDATAGVDYVATSGVLIIPAGSTSGTIEVKIIGDLLKESNERFWLNFSNPVNVIISGDPRSRVMIIDDDKGKNTQTITTTASADLRESPINIPNVVKRNHVWMIPSAITRKSEVEIINILGEVVFRVNNYNNDIPVGNVAVGMYFYKIRSVEVNGNTREYIGKLFITE